MKILLSLLVVCCFFGIAGAEEDLGSLKARLEQGGAGVVSLFQEKLKNGTAQEKEAVLDIFMESPILWLIPDVIEATLDDTPLPRHEDTGWGNVYHQAASALINLKYHFESVGDLEAYLRNRDFSFYDEVGTATLERRQEVHQHWLDWWQKNKSGWKE
jgi:hypothetical protein